MDQSSLKIVVPIKSRSRGSSPLHIAVLILLGIALLLLLGMGVLVARAVSFRQQSQSIDAITGSTKSQETWLHFITTGPKVEISPLELRLLESGVTRKQDWRFIHNTHYDVLGESFCHECGGSIPIYILRPWLKEFADASTDAELREFVRVMQFGTKAEQVAMVDAACKKVFETP